jgi:hypothetical protein
MPLKGGIKLFLNNIICIFMIIGNKLHPLKTIIYSIKMTKKVGRAIKNTVLHECMLILHIIIVIKTVVLSFIRVHKIIASKKEGKLF